MCAHLSSHSCGEAASTAGGGGAGGAAERVAKKGEALQPEEPRELLLRARKRYLEEGRRPEAVKVAPASPSATHSPGREAASICTLKLRRDIRTLRIIENMSCKDTTIVCVTRHFKWDLQSGAGRRKRVMEVELRSASTGAAGVAGRDTPPEAVNAEA